MEARKKILIIEDDKYLRHALRGPLAKAGYQLLEADGAKVGLHLFRTEKPDLVILDINLSDSDGFSVCKDIRTHKTLPSIPIIMLTGRAALKDKAAGFELGADQYLVKPVPGEELLMWVEALLRRIRYDKEEGDELRAGDLVIELKSRLVRYKEQVFPHLTSKEFDLLYFLVKKRPSVLSRKYLLSSLWHTVRVDRLVDVHINNLRKKLPSELALKIQTVPGEGFRFFD